MTKNQKYTFFTGGLLVMLCMTLSSYGIATVTPQLLTRYNAMNHYTLTSLMASIGMLLFLPVCGKLIDTLGRRTMCMIGGVLTLIPSVVCGFAPNFEVFIVSRALITVGSACVAALPSSCYPYVFNREELPKLYGLQGGFAALGTFFGSTIAGVMDDAGITWLAVAYPGILTFVGCMMMFVLMPKLPKKPMPAIDFAGILTIALFVVPLVYASSFGNAQGWDSPMILGCFALMILSIILLIVIEKRVKNPLIDLNLFKNKMYTGALLVSFLIVLYQSAMRVYVPLQVQNVMGQSSAMSGTVLLPRSILSIVLPTLCGAWVGKDIKNRAWKSIMIAGASVGVGMLIVGMSPTLIACFVGLGLTGVAESFKQSSVTPMATMGLPKEQYGSGMSMISMAGSMGSAVGSAIFGVIFETFAPDTTIVVDVARGNQWTFLVSAITGGLVVLVALLILRQKKSETIAEGRHAKG